MRALPRLVVLDDPPGAERVDVDPVDLPREEDVVGELEAALELRSRALRSEGDFEPTRDESHLRRGLVAEESFEIRAQGVPELGRLQLGEIEPYSGLERGVETAMHERGRRLEILGRDALGVELSREHRVEAMQCRVEHLAAKHRVGLGVDSLGIDHPLEEPRRRAVGEPFELGRGEDGLGGERLEHGGALQRRRAVERHSGAVESPRPVVRGCEGVRTFHVVGCETHDRAKSFAVARRRLERPGQGGERSAPGRPLNLHVVEQRPDVLPERARLARRAFIAGGLSHENEALRCACAGRIEEVAVTCDGVRPYEASPELATGVVGEERRGAGTPRERSLLEPEHEDHVEGPRPRVLVVEHRDATGRRALWCDPGPLERSHDVVLGERDATLREGLQLVEAAHGDAVCTGIDASLVSDGRRLESPGVPHHELDQLAHPREWTVRRAHCCERRDVRSAQALGLLVHAIRLGDRAAAEASFHEVDRTTLEPGERRA